MEVEYQNSQSDINKFLKSYLLKKEFTKRLLLLVILSAFFGSVRLNNEPFDFLTFSYRTAIAILVLFAIIFILPYLAAKIQLERSLEIKPHKIVLSEDGIRIILDYKNDFWRWETVNKADRTENYLFFTLFTKVIYLIPQNAFSSNNEAINFLGIIKSNTIKFKEHSKPRKINSLYYWGLLALFQTLV